MELEELRKLVADLQHRQLEPDAVEAKAARGGTPKKLYDSLSAFANRPGGGVILFGVDENESFKVVGVNNYQQIQETVTNLARDEMEPPLTPEFTIDEIDGATVMCCEVLEIEPGQKPCYYKSKGMRGGAYIRSGGTDRPMSDYEVFSYINSRGRPTDDETPVVDATLNDLDSGLIDEYLTALKQRGAASRMLEGEREEILKRLYIVRDLDGTYRPTNAGLAFFGKYPQEFFPQLRITFVQYYGVSEDERTPGGERFLDNQSFEGPITEMLSRAEVHVTAAMRKSSLIEGLMRTDVLEYPQEALREILANAVAHRDYSSNVVGSQVQIKMFANRLEVISPGGLHGIVNIDNIEDEASTRNARLMRIMEDMRVVENRGSGINAILSAMREANLEPPVFVDRRTSFCVTLHNHTLMNPNAIEWLNQFADRDINDKQRLALVYLRQKPSIDNAAYRRLNRVDAATAGQELRGLVGEELVKQEGMKRWTYYQLAVSPELPEEETPTTDAGRVVAYVKSNGSISNSQCRELLGINNDQAYYLLSKLIDDGQLKPEGKGKGRKYVLKT